MTEIRIDGQFCGEGPVGIAGFQLDPRGDIGVPVAVNCWRVCLRRPLEIDDGGPRVVIHVDTSRTVFGDVGGLGEDGGDRLADIANLAAGQHRRFRRVGKSRIGVAVRENPGVHGQIVRRDHGDDALQSSRFPRIDRDRRPGGPAAHDRDMQHSGIADVVDEPSPAGEERRVLRPGLPFAEQGHLDFFLPPIP